MKRKGFTLAELLAVVTILGIIALIVFLTVNNAVKKSREKSYNQQIESILKSAKTWGLENRNSLSDTSKNYITIEELQRGGYLDSKDTINPVTNEKMNGCIVITYDTEYNQYTYDYNEKTCAELSGLPFITLKGESFITIGLGDTYTEFGATAIYKDTDISNFVTITDNINVNQVGKYYVKYNVTYDGLKAKEVVRTIKVIDDSPVITLKGDNTVTIGLYDEYTDEGATAQTYNGTDITSSILVTNNVDTTTIGTYQVKYNVTYNGKSAQEVTRTVKVVDDSPIITLNGDSLVTTRINETYTDEGATAKTYDGTDITSNITTTNNVDITTEGTYQVKYNVTYNGKSAQEVTRTVKVVGKDPIIILSEYETSKYEKSITIDVTVIPYTGNTISTLVYKLDGGTEQTVNNNQITIDTDGSHTLEVIATDNEGNIGTITGGSYNIDVIAPTITFEEDETVGITLDISEIETDDLKSGMEVTDNLPISKDNVTISGNLAAIPGEYTLTYTATDTVGNTTSKTRKVTVYCPTVTIMGKTITEACNVRKSDPDKNLRFVGADPDNYVEFNGELWRIIGVFNGQAKIIKDDFYNTSIKWNSKFQCINSNDSCNDWSDASLKDTLNGSYLTSIQTNDPTSYNYIDLTYVWNTGGMSSTIRKDAYTDERGTIVPERNHTTWTGAIALMYPSDYGYSTSSISVGCDKMSEWNLYSECYNNSWIHNTNYQQLTLTTQRYSQLAIYLVDITGELSNTNSDVARGVKPVLYLKSDVMISSGTGDSEDPFILTQ